MGYQQVLHNQHNPHWLMSTVAALQMPLWGENRDISHYYYSLNFKYTAEHHSKDQEKSVYLKYEEKTFSKRL